MTSVALNTGAGGHDMLRGRPTSSSRVLEPRKRLLGGRGDFSSWYILTSIIGGLQLVVLFLVGGRGGGGTSSGKLREPHRRLRCRGGSGTVGSAKLVGLLLLQQNARKSSTCSVGSWGMGILILRSRGNGLNAEQDGIVVRKHVEIMMGRESNIETERMVRKSLGVRQ